MTAPLQRRTPSTTVAPTAPTAPPTPPTDGAPGWDDTRDPVFFRIVGQLFRPADTLAMTVLLASYDDSDDGDDSDDDEVPERRRTLVNDRPPVYRP